MFGWAGMMAGIVLGGNGGEHCCRRERGGVRTRKERWQGRELKGLRRVWCVGRTTYVPRHLLRRRYREVERISMDKSHSTGLRQVTTVPRN